MGSPQGQAIAANRALFLVGTQGFSWTCVVLPGGWVAGGAEAGVARAVA